MTSTMQINEGIVIAPNQYNVGGNFFRFGAEKTELENQLENCFSSLDYDKELEKLKRNYDHTNEQNINLDDMDGFLNDGHEKVSNESNENDSVEEYHDTFTGLYQDYNRTVGQHQEKVVEGELFNCFTCGKIDTIKNINGMNICIHCGIEKGPVISEDMECQYAGMALGDNSCTARSGMSNNRLLFQSNFSTKIVGNKTSYSLKQINNVWDSLNYKERTLLKIFKKIADNCRQNGIPNNVISYSQVLYTKAYNKQRSCKKGNKGSRADKLEGLIGGCIYYSCKAYNINRSHQEIADICGIDKSAVSYGCKLTFRLLHHDIDLNANRTNYRDFLERYGSHLKLNNSELDIVKECCQEICKLQILNHSKPSTIAAVSIYVCSELYDFGLEKKEIAEACNTTEPTLNKNYRIVMDHVDQIIV